MNNNINNENQGNMNNQENNTFNPNNQFNNNVMNSTSSSQFDVNNMQQSNNNYIPNPNNQFINNGMSQNPNNQFNNNGMNSTLSSQFNNNSANANNVDPNKSKINKKLIGIIGIIIVVVIVGILLIKGFGGSSTLGGHKNTTGLSDYKDSDVDNNCVYIGTYDDGKTTIYVDILFNYKSGTNNYQVKTYYKVIEEFSNGLTDKQYEKYVKSLNSINCLLDECTASHLELDVSKFGSDTIVDRKGNRIEITANEPAGMGATATKNDKEEFIKDFKDQGFKCN